MGSFSWIRAERTTARKNIAVGDIYKILIPQEFGGGFIRDEYYGSGAVFGADWNHMADLYGIIAYWNKSEGMIYDGDEYPSTMEDILNRGNTCLQENRCKGIEIGCDDKDIFRLKYPLKLVSASYHGTYEECEGKSYRDPEQGCRKTYWSPQKKRFWYTMGYYSKEYFYINEAKSLQKCPMRDDTPCEVCKNCFPGIYHDIPCDYIAGKDVCMQCVKNNKLKEWKK